MTHPNLLNAKQVLKELGFPKRQTNDRSALVLLAIIDLTPNTLWADAAERLIGITPIMDWMRENYGKIYKPNSRETVRRQTIHQFRDAGLIVSNPDKPDRPVNSQDSVYQIAPDALALLRSYGSADWSDRLATYLETWRSLAEQYAKARNMQRIPVRLANGQELQLTPGAHSKLIRDIIMDFAPRFAPDSILIYAGDTGEKLGYFDEERLADLGIKLNSHGKMPDVIFHYTARNWLLLVESVTSHGPVDAKRHTELMTLFAGSTAGLVYVTAFPSRTVMAKYVADIAWETEVWVADAPTHLIHFNGIRFLGPYDPS